MIRIGEFIGWVFLIAAVMLLLSLLQTPRVDANGNPVVLVTGKYK